jgi:hypothetical protein
MNARAATRPPSRNSNPVAVLREFEKISLTINEPKSRVIFIMLIVRQPSRPATKAAFAAIVAIADCCERLFGGWSHSDSKEAPRTMTNNLIPYVLRSG